MNHRLSPESIRLVKTTARAFKTFGREIADAVFARMLSNPDACGIFKDGRLCTPERATEFGENMLAIAEHIDTLGLLSDRIDRMAHRHIDEGWKPEFYPIFLNALLPAIRDVLGEGATDPVLDAWRECYWHFARHLIAKETILYQQLGVQKAA